MSTRPDFIIKTDSTDPVYSVQLRTRSTQNEPGSEPVDLTNADTVEFLMPIPDEDGMVREDATIVDAASGDVEVRLPSGIGDGDYDAEFRVDFEDGETLFWPQHHNLLVAVRAGTDRELDPADLSDPDASVTTLFVDELEANTGESISVASDTDHNGNDVSNVGALDTDEIYTGEQTVYVDPDDGDDDNTGLSENDPKRTINAAIHDAPIHQSKGERLTVVLEQGTYTDQRRIVDLGDTHHSKIAISGSTDANGDPDSTLDAEGEISVLLARNVDVEVENCQFLNGYVGIRLLNQSSMELGNCWVISGSGGFQCVAIQSGSRFEDDEDCFYDHSAASDDPNSCIEAVGGAWSRFSGEYIGGDDTYVISVKEQSNAYIRPTARIDGQGDGRAVGSRKNSNIKFEPQEVRNADIGVYAEGGGFVSVRNEPTYENISQTFGTGKLGRFEFVPDEADLVHTPSNSGGDRPSVEQEGITHFNIESGRGEIYAGTFDDWMEFGENVLFEGSTTVTAGQEEVVETFGSTGRHYRMVANVTDAEGDVRVVDKLGYNSGGDFTEFIVEETTGEADAEVEYKVFQIGRH